MDSDDNDWLDDNNGNDRELIERSTQNELGKIYDLGFREGRLSQEDYLEEQFIQGAFEGFSDGNLSGIVEGKIYAILVFLKKSSDQEHKKQQEDKIREMEDRFNSNKHDRSVLEQLIKELDQIKVI